MTRRDAPDNFASAAMIRLVAAGLARQRIKPHGRPPSGAHVGQATKRDVLDTVIIEHGRLTLLRIADALPHLPPEPLQQALLKARDIADLLDRWHRLERFSHARHEVVAKRLGPHAFRLRHQARDDGPLPSEAETLLVAGVLAVFAEQVTGRAVTLAPEDGTAWRQGGHWSPGASHRRGAWLVLTGAPPCLASTPMPPVQERDIIAATRRHIAADPVHRWTIAELASATALSERTLQRRLADGAASFSRLLIEVRLETAARYLCDRSGPGLAEIAFLSGFSDQAHFTRSFAKAVGTTPNAYRADFAA